MQVAILRWLATTTVAGLLLWLTADIGALALAVDAALMGAFMLILSDTYVLVMGLPETKEKPRRLSRVSNLLLWAGYSLAAAGLVGDVTDLPWWESLVVGVFAGYYMGLVHAIRHQLDNIKEEE